MVKVPALVAKTADYFFKLKKIGFKGAIETGNKRAKQLSSKSEISLKDIRYIRAWFARHKFTSYPTYKKWLQAGRPKTKDQWNKRGIQAWNSWGGNAGFRWVNSKKIINLLNKHYNTDFKPDKLK